MNFTRLENRINEYALLMRLDKPIGTFLLLWPTLWALWLAGHGHPPQKIVIVFMLGVFLMRSAGCVINDIADRNLDPFVARTRQRPLAAKRVSVAEALMLFGVLCGSAFALVLLTNRLTVILSLIGAILAASYPIMKRFHYFPQVHLGVAFGWSIPMAFAATTNHVPPVAWLLFTANVIWAVVYDTMYAMVDRKDDLQMGVKSTAILFDSQDKHILGYLQMLLLGLLALIGLLMKLGLAYYLGLFAAAWFALYQQYLIRNRQPVDCFKAFLNNNWFGLTVFCGILLDYLPDTVV
jgi:4-hydroxybenzoate polyprenyltransferase